MFAAGLRVARINLKPLLPERQLNNFRPERWLKELEKELMTRIRSNIFQEAFSPQAKRRLLAGFRIVQNANSITVIATDPAFRPLIEGRKKKQMVWLTKAAVPIPIVLDSGEVIFRNATPHSMSNGSWYHPPKKSYTVIERARDEARRVVKEKAKSLLLRQIRDSLKRGLT